MRQIVAFIILNFFFPLNILLGQESIVIFSGDLRGEIKPCGCAEEGDMGGLLRRHTFLKQQQLLNPSLFYFDLGNNFPKPSEQGDLKINLIQKAFKKFPPDAVLVGPNEWLNGLHWLEKRIPYLLTNYGGNFNFLKSIIIEEKGQILSVFGYLSPNLVYQNKNDPPLLLPVNRKLVKDWRKKLGSEPEGFRLLLFRGNVDELQKFEEAGLFDLIVAGSVNDNELKQVMNIRTKSGIFPMIPTKGQGILTMKISDSGKLIPEKNEIVPAGLSITWLRKSISDATELEKTFKDYNDAVKELFFSNLDRKENQRKQSPFVGVQVCLGCHLNSGNVWKSSRHSKAFETLEKISKHFDPECLACHVVGLKPWEFVAEDSKIDPQIHGALGFLSPKLTPHLKNVQCENCHGPARAHISNNKIAPANKDPKSLCVSCHHGSHSPMFNFESYWEKIIH